MSRSAAKLFLCPTPIGNLEDISLRVLRTLEEVDVIYCEDTRHSRGLLQHYNIKKPLRSFHSHNEEKAGQDISATLKKGLNVALLSDAGMPGVSDPGALAVRICQKEGLDYTVLPGPSASLTALVMSGLANDRFIFEGFLPRKGKEREKRLESLDRQTATAILYESPHRIMATLEEFAERWPKREGALCREISKFYEDCRRGSFQSLLESYQEEAPKGEIVLLLEGIQSNEEDSSFETALEQARQGLLEGLGLNQAAKLAAQNTGQKKRDIYQALLNEREG